ncbi:MAG: type II secretory pathway pseudopilin PulG [Phycisphaerales bacterium]|jgi:type II secretory pathway pseudopilin PulG
MRQVLNAAQRGRLAFTVTELVVVVAIIAMITSIAVPSFSSMVQSTNRSLAINSIDAAVGVARDLALRSGRGGDGAVVVVQRANGTVQLIPALQVGTFNDYEPLPPRGPTPPTAANIANQVERDVFVPVPQAEVIELPAGWGIAGYAPPGSMREASQTGFIRDTWYDSELYGGDRDLLPREKGNWVLPETSYYDTDLQANTITDQSTGRQSFMIRFDAKTGTASRSQRGALFVDPRPSNDRPFRRRAKDSDSKNLATDTNWKRVDQAPSIERWASRAISDPDPTADGYPYGEKINPNRPAAVTGGEDVELIARSEIIGSRSNDTILCKPVDRVAIFLMEDLARGIGARGLNVRTRSIYKPWARGEPQRIQIDDSLFGGATMEDIRVNMNRWIAGDTGGGSRRVGGAGQLLGDGKFVFSEDDTNYQASPSNIDEPRAILFAVSPYTGDVTEAR